MANPLEINSKRYSIRANFKCTLLPDPSDILLKRKDRVQERLVSDQQTFDSLLDIHKIFVDPGTQANMSSFGKFDFTSIACYPNQMLKFKDIREFPIFSGSAAIIATQHWDVMKHCFMLPNTTHLDVMRLNGLKLLLLA